MPGRLESQTDAAARQLVAAAAPQDAAETLLAGLEGAMLVSRPFEGSRRFDAIASSLLAALGAAPRAGV